MEKAFIQQSLLFVLNAERIQSMLRSALMRYSCKLDHENPANVSLKHGTSSSPKLKSSDPLLIVTQYSALLR